jgi:hypothetical protein
MKCGTLRLVETVDSYGSIIDVDTPAASGYFLATPDLRMLEFIALSPLFEILATGALFAVALLWPRKAAKWIRRVERALSRIAARPLLAYALIALLGFAPSMMLSLTGRLPQPTAHDEFGYLLSADTFLHGRLTNPTHPMWTHFETFHIIHQPTYMSKYPPAQGAILALGSLIAHPIVGVWLSTVLACVAVYWMLLAWTPPWLALLGSIVTAFHPAFLLIWGQIYWGGQLAMAGGALVFGAVGRIVRRRHPRAGDALLMGIGLALLANRRPYEGLVASIPVAVALIAWIFGKTAPPLKLSLKRVVLPILIVILPTGVWMAYDNWRVTGDPLRMPFMLYESTYTLAPVFLWQKPWPLPAYRHKPMADFYRGELLDYMEQRSLAGFIQGSRRKLEILWLFYQGIRPLRWPLVVPLLALPWLLRNRRTRFALATLALFICGLLALTWAGAHYAPPIAAVVIFLGLQGARSLRLWRWRKVAIGRPLMASLAFVMLVTFIAHFAAALVDKRGDRDPSWHFARAELNETLGKQGHHLIVVRYGPQHNPYEEWVYNDADIDGSAVVWAREMSAPKNQKLFDYFKDRTVWLLDIGNDEWPPKLTRYPSASER